MPKKLKIWLPDNWANISDQNPDGPLTMCWDDATASGALQLSVAEYSGGKEPRPSEADLIKQATDFGQRRRWGQLVHSSSGPCVLGIYGTASFTRPDSMPTDDAQYAQIWFLSNGLDFVMVTFFGMVTPPECELFDTQRIVEAIDLK